MLVNRFLGPKNTKRALMGYNDQVTLSDDKRMSWLNLYQLFIYLKCKKFSLKNSIEAENIKCVGTKWGDKETQRLH